MNNRIQEIANQVERIRDLYNIGPVHRDAVEQFAELIVKECLDELAVWRFSEPSEAWMLERNYGIDFCMDKIKESFGVEE